MHSVKSIPFLRILLPFLLGLTIYKLSANLPLWFFVGLFFVGLLWSILFQFLSFKQKLKLSWSNGVALHILLLGLGFLISHYHQIENQKDWYKNIKTQSQNNFFPL